MLNYHSAGEDCEAYIDAYGRYKSKLDCSLLWCCGTCENRYCCGIQSLRLSESKQDSCMFSGGMNTLTISSLVAAAVIIMISFICCCVCPCCCLYKMCRKPRPVIATTTHTTVVNTQYPQQPVQPYQGAPQYPQQPVQPYQGAPQYPAFQPMPVQPGYGGGQPVPTAPGYQGQPFQPGPPPPYQETGPAYPPAIPVPYSQAGFSPGQPSYPLQPPAQCQPAYPGAPPAQPDFLSAQPNFLSAQPAYNPAFVEPQPPKTGY
ncbi:protein shisa-4 isoform X2 [Coregonus clupeaformis]|uniref:protein shisa-4 isoform X2 n=1 Tax=Coregonus clupeaformis TaxID=59861 RepID=UPI001BE0FE24|nr:protein shisa-4 isoform X2 [Coregonus clupeaformis]